MIFLKLGGSLITDKTQVETVREEVLARVAQEVAQARQAYPYRPMVLGHGSGSFGHTAAAKHGTRKEVRTPAQWQGFAEVTLAASRLNQIVAQQLVKEGLPVVSFAPHNWVQCNDGVITQAWQRPVASALDMGAIPLIYGDVAFDEERGGTIVSTEEVMTILAQFLQPPWLLLAGETQGVYDERGQLIPRITPFNIDAIRPSLMGSRGTDVTGGMLSKVLSMLALVEHFPFLTVRIFSGLETGNIGRLLAEPQTPIGTIIAAE